jgi:hypothetical protein
VIRQLFKIAWHHGEVSFDEAHKTVKHGDVDESRLALSEALIAAKSNASSWT